MGTIFERKYKQKDGTIKVKYAIKQPPEGQVICYGIGTTLMP